MSKESGQERLERCLRHAEQHRQDETDYGVTDSTDTHGRVTFSLFGKQEGQPDGPPPERGSPVILRYESRPNASTKNPPMVGVDRSRLYWAKGGDGS